MGPVWEANHLWSIFVIVVLFTGFPYGYAPLAVALFLPFHLALVGIMLRGASFVLRGFYCRTEGTTGTPPPSDRPLSWRGTVFGIASAVSPFLLGKDAAVPWLSAYAVGCGPLALSTCAYLASVYPTVETGGDLREDFRHRAISLL